MIRRLVQKRGHVVVQRIHVLHQPIICLVVHLRDKTEGRGHYWFVCLCVGKMTDVEDDKTNKETKKMRYLASIVNDGEVSFPAWLLWTEEFWMAALLAGQLLYKRAVCCPGEPALFIQQGQNTRRVGLIEIKNTETFCCGLHNTSGFKAEPVFLFIFFYSLFITSSAGVVVERTGSEGHRWNPSAPSRYFSITKQSGLSASISSLLMR